MRVSDSLCRSGQESSTQSYGNFGLTGRDRDADYVLHPAAERTDARVAAYMHGWRSSEHFNRARPSWMICALRSPGGRRHARVRRCRTARHTAHIAQQRSSVLKAITDLGCRCRATLTGRHHRPGHPRRRWGAMSPRRSLDGHSPVARRRRSGRGRDPGGRRARRVPCHRNAAPVAARGSR